VRRFAICLLSKQDYVRDKKLHEIVRKLNKDGIPAARGVKWHTGTVKYILENLIDKGILHYETELSERRDLAIR